MTDKPRVGLIRLEHTDDGTFGVLALPGGVLCHTIELPWKDNRQNVSCIPLGEYECEMIASPGRGNVYWVKDVLGRTEILIHAGNFAGDPELGKRTDLAGCIAPGMARGALDGQEVVLSSRPALTRFHSRMDRQPFTLVVEDES